MTNQERIEEINALRDEISTEELLDIVQKHWLFLVQQAELLEEIGGYCDNVLSEGNPARDEAIEVFGRKYVSGMIEQAGFISGIINKPTKDKE